MRYEECNRDEVGVEMVPPEFVPVVFASNMEKAEHLQSVLEGYNIPALIDGGGGPEGLYTSLGRGVPVMVPDQMHDRACVIVADEESGAAPLLSAGDDDEEDEELFDEDDDFEDEDFDDDLDDLDEDDEDDDYEDEDEDDDEFDENLDDYE